MGEKKKQDYINDKIKLPKKEEEEEEEEDWKKKIITLNKQ